MLASSLLRESVAAALYQLLESLGPLFELRPLSWLFWWQPLSCCTALSKSTDCMYRGRREAASLFLLFSAVMKDNPETCAVLISCGDMGNHMSHGEFSNLAMEPEELIIKSHVGVLPSRILPVACVSTLTQLGGF